MSTDEKLTALTEGWSEQDLERAKRIVREWLNQPRRGVYPFTPMAGKKGGEWQFWIEPGFVIPSFIPGFPSPYHLCTEVRSLIPLAAEVDPKWKRRAEMDWANRDWKLIVMKDGKGLWHDGTYWAITTEQGQPQDADTAITQVPSLAKRWWIEAGGWWPQEYEVHD